MKSTPSHNKGAVRIDAHHHLWRFTPEEYGWIDDSSRALQRDFLLDDLRAEMQSAGISATVAVQARQTVGETRWLLELASDAASPIAGVVGWLPIADASFADVLDDFAGETKLKGVRHVVQAEPAGFLDGEAFNKGMQALRGTGLVYDVLIFAPQLQEAIRFVDRHPEQVFVLDHVGKPAIRNGEIVQWARDIRELACRSHVSCKVSGMVTEADPQQWSAELLKPYFDVLLEAFGPERLMVGTDWPVLTIGCAYAQWWTIVEGWIAGLSETEQSAILGGNAARLYQLGQPEGAGE